MISKSLLKKIRKAVGPYAPYKNYVGGEGTVLHKILGPYLRTAWWCDLNYAAYVHDGLYEIGGERQDKDFADEAFLQIMYRLIKETRHVYGTGWTLKRLARRRAYKYYVAVNVFGDEHFNWRIS